MRQAAFAQLDAVESAPVREDSRAPKGGFKGFGSWNNLFGTRIETDAGDASLELVSFTPKRDPDADLKQAALDLIAAAGINVSQTLTVSDLDAIARASRNGAVARRVAVVDAAPLAINRLLKHLKRNTEGQNVAGAFRARPDLAKSEQKGEASDLVCAYLLIDAALD
jgi:hypothetical protein